MKNSKAVFLDRDGVLTRPIIKSGQAFSAREMSELDFYDEALEMLSGFQKAGFLLFVVTNQPDIARGKMDKETVDQMHKRLMDWAATRAPIKRVYCCFHDDSDQCDCRKPKPGMLRQAAQEFNVDLSRSYLIGDRQKDIEAGQSSGCISVLMDAPYNQDVLSDYRAKGHADACAWILKQYQD